MRVVVYDRTAGALTLSWRTGVRLYRRLGRIDDAFGATSWAEALDWLSAKPVIDEIQYWGHGKWGHVLVDRDELAAPALRDASHALHPKLEAVRDRLAPDALVWMRTCEAFGATAGHDFAMRLADFFGTRVAGHTFVIGALQSGLHGLRPGHKPDWTVTEGLKEGTPDKPKKAFDSGPRRPNTISCFQNEVPPRWFA